MSDPLEGFLVVPPGLEQILAEEARANGFKVTSITGGGVSINGDWPEIWRANLVLRGATRVLVRLGGFPAVHLSQLDKRARKFPWSATFRPDIPVKVDVTTRKSKIYHAGAAKQRIETALKDSLGVDIAKGDTKDDALTLKLRIDQNVCTFSIDSSGEPLHKRGFKAAVGKAPMRETLAALFLRACGYSGNEPVLDPMCGSGTFVIEAAEIARDLPPGRARRFAFEDLKSFDRDIWDRMKSECLPAPTNLVFHGSDRDAGAVANSQTNADRAGVRDITRFTQAAISDLQRPDGPPGLVMINPPYGGRIGNTKMLYALHGAMGKTLLDRFSGWRVGLVTNEPALAHATGLPWGPVSRPVDHGGLKIKLYQTGALP